MYGYIVDISNYSFNKLSDIEREQYFVLYNNLILFETCNKLR